MPWWTCPKCKTQYCYCVGDNPTCTCLKVPEIKPDKVVDQVKRDIESRKPKFYQKHQDKDSAGKNITVDSE